MARADEFMMSFQRATTAWAWGWAWGDPTLDRNFPAHCGCREKEPCGFSHFGVVIIPPRGFDRHQILLTIVKQAPTEQVMSDRAARREALRHAVDGDGAGCRALIPE
jgi:hypothetical protein